MKRFNVLSLVLAVSFALLTGAALAGHTGQRIILAIPQDEGELTPYTYVTGYPGYNMLSLVFDTLMLNDLGDVPRPWLAESVTSANGGRQWTIKLREGAVWHDGKPLTSADVKFSYEYYKKYPLIGRFATAVRGISDIRTPDERTVVITLPRPEANFQQVTLADVPILPQHLWQNVTDPRAFKNATGSGPFKLVEHRPDQSYRLVENPSYFGGKPGADEVVLSIIKDATSTFQALQAGQVSATSREVLPELIGQFSNNPRLKVVRGPGYASTLLQFNTTIPPFNEVRFRQAVAGLIDTKGLVETLLLGYGTPGNAGFVHPQSPFYSAATREYKRLSVAEAGKVLDSLGYRAGAGGVRVGKDGKRLEFTLLVQSNNPLRIRAAELIAQQVRPAGIVFNVRSLDPTTVQQAVWPDFDVAKGRNFELAMWGWSAPVTSQLNLRGLFNSNPAAGTLNIGGYKNPTVDSLTERMVTTVDFDQRKQLATQVQTIIARDLPFITLWYADGVYAYRPEAYDGWKFQKGQGIINKRSFLQGQ